MHATSVQSSQHHSPRPAAPKMITFSFDESVLEDNALAMGAIFNPRVVTHGRSARLATVAGMGELIAPVASRESMVKICLIS